jgi:hypothetical protein
MDFERLTTTTYSKKLIDFVELCMTFAVVKRPNIVELIQFIAEEILAYADQAKKEMTRANENLAKTLRKMPAFLGTDGEPVQTGMGTETAKIKIGVENLQPIKNDPFLPLFECLCKIMNVVNQPYNPDQEDERKRFIVEHFFRRIAMTSLQPEQLGSLKKELFAVLAPLCNDLFL